MNPYIINLSGALAKNFLNYGLNQNEFIILNSFLLTTRNGDINFSSISNMTNFSEEEINNVISSLAERGKISISDNILDLDKLESDIYKIEQSFKPLTQRIIESRKMAQMYSEDEHYGIVELHPEDHGISIRTLFNGKGYVWSKKRIIELAEELINFADSVEQENIDRYNSNLKKRREFEHQQAQQRREERQQEKKKSAIPQPGFVVIFRLSNGRYKFSYSVKSSLQGKIEILKDQYGNTIQIVHSIETHDTFKFYHQFLKKQFSNRSIEGNNSEFALREEDINYLREEKFPSNAMEWAFGTVSHG